MDWNNIWGQAKESISNAWDQAVTVGTPVIKAAAEKELLNLVNKQHAETKEELKQVIGQATAGPDTVAGSLVKEALLDQYKYHILAGVALLIGVGYALRK